MKPGGALLLAVVLAVTACGGASDPPSGSESQWALVGGSLSVSGAEGVWVTGGAIQREGSDPDPTTLRPSNIAVEYSVDGSARRFVKFHLPAGRFLFNGKVLHAGGHDVLLGTSCPMTYSEDAFGCVPAGRVPVAFAVAGQPGESKAQPLKLRGAPLAGYGADELSDVLGVLAGRVIVSQGLPSPTGAAPMPAVRIAALDAVTRRVVELPEAPGVLARTSFCISGSDLLAVVPVLTDDATLTAVRLARLRNGTSGAWVDAGEIPLAPTRPTGGRIHCTREHVLLRTEEGAESRFSTLEAQDSREPLARDEGPAGRLTNIHQPTPTQLLFTFATDDNATYWTYGDHGGWQLHGERPLASGQDIPVGFLLGTRILDAGPLLRAQPGHRAPTPLLIAEGLPR